MLEILFARRIIAGTSMIEHSKRPLLPRAVYLKILARNFALAPASSPSRWASGFWAIIISTNCRGWMRLKMRR
jgi:hypothetical protein